MVPGPTRFICGSHFVVSWVVQVIYLAAISFDVSAYSVPKPTGESARLRTTTLLRRNYVFSNVGHVALIFEQT